MTIREEAQAILGVHINDNGWQMVRRRLAIEGKFDNKKQQELIMMICEHLERIEKNANVPEKTINE